MKTLEKQIEKIYRFRCDRCQSLFEMTQEEKMENDWLFHEGNKKALIPHNPLDKFMCPVCNCQRHVRSGDMHCFHVMDNGKEIQEY